MDSTAEKYAFEIEIFTLNRGFRAQISRSCEQKRRFQQSVRGQSGRTDFFNTIDRFLPVAIVSFGSITTRHARQYSTRSRSRMRGAVMK
jgi:hypothetical protein